MLKNKKIIFNSKSLPKIIRSGLLHSQKDIAKPELRQETKKFEMLVDKSERVLFKATAVFPFVFFPSSIIIDENKVNIIHRLFFFSDETQSILIHHIKDVIVDRSLFFATIKILPEGYNEEWVYVNYLWRRDATRARKIINGLLVGMKEGVDVTKVTTPDFNKKVELLGAIN